MEKEDARKQSREMLHMRRKQVMRLHRKGVGVMQIVEQTGLSWSGVNTALRLFAQGGAAALKLRAAATEHMTRLENTPERVKKYFGDKHVAYAAGS